jgi:hypothetical protein
VAALKVYLRVEMPPRDGPEQSAGREAHIRDRRPSASTRPASAGGHHQGAASATPSVEIRLSNASRPEQRQHSSCVHQRGRLVLQLDGSAPIFSPRSTRLFIVSRAKVPSTGGYQSPGIETMRTSTSALRLSLAISAIA